MCFAPMARCCPCRGTSCISRWATWRSETTGKCAAM
jgi:hypothetical protein